MLASRLICPITDLRTKESDQFNNYALIALRENNYDKYVLVPAVLKSIELYNKCLKIKSE
jgi:hypothetical protein